jgi:hypothetical protein
MPQSNPRSEKTAEVAQNVKRFEDYARSRPEQFSLFELIELHQRSYSNTIELYDFIPKYVWGRVNRVSGRFLDRLERIFECRGQRYVVKIDPAKLQDKDGVVRDYFPSKREELVEDALRKLAAEGQGVFLDEQAAVTFTLHQLQKELERSGHGYNKNEIKDALLICAKTRLEVCSEDGTMVFVSGIFETLGLQTQEDWRNTGTKTKCFVRFNPLVTRSIRDLSFRQVNYELSMAYESVIARQLHKRLSHHYTQASVLAAPYAILLSTLIRDFGLTPYKELRNNLRDVMAALNEMTEKDVIGAYEVQKILDAGRRNRLADAKIILRTSLSFNREVAAANARRTPPRPPKPPRLPSR